MKNLVSTGFRPTLRKMRVRKRTGNAVGAPPGTGICALRKDSLLKTLPKQTIMRLPEIRSHAAALAALLLFAVPDVSALARERVPLDRGWHFHHGDVDGAEAPAFEPRGWETVHLPHDWSIGLETDPDAASAGGGGYFPTGTGWYRHEFEAPAHWVGRRIEIEFEGVYRNATVWINGERLGKHPSGYTPFRFDLTPHVTLGEANHLAVRVENEPQPHSRWYTGSGIYRPVWLDVTHPVHVAPYGVEVAPWDVYPETATMWVKVEVRNTKDTPQTARVETVFIDPEHYPLHSAGFEIEIPPGETAMDSRKIPIARPDLWSPDNPALYRAVTRVWVGDLMTDRVETTFGVRDVRVRPEFGFELIRDQQLHLFGGNVHHDNGPLGAAAHAAAEERKVRLLKAAGFNAVRTAHNLPSTAFLEACDRLGLMVINEVFDGWRAKKLPHDYGEIFDDWWKYDLDMMIRRDRNHASVVMWSIGNEMYERAAPRAVDMAEAMVERVRSFETAHPNNPVRLATAGVNGLGETGDWSNLDPLFATLDVAGYNYELHRHAEDHERVPGRIIYGSESYQVDAFASWAATNDNPYVIGDFVWSAIDYLGEAGIGRVFPPDEEPFAHWEGSHYPWHGAACGDIDITGYRKPVSHYRNIVWDRGETLYAAVEKPAPDGGSWNLSQWAVPPMRADWNWPGQEGEPLRVEVYSRHEAVRLYLNGRRVGEAPTTRAEEFKAVFSVPYQPGELKAVGLRGGKEVETFVLETAGEPARIALQPERFSLQADGNDLAFIVVEIVDDDDHRLYAADDSVTYSITGPGEIVAVGSADLTSRESYHATTRRVFEGRALVVVRSLPESGEIELKAHAPGLGETKVSIEVGYF